MSGRLQKTVLPSTVLLALMSGPLSAKEFTSSGLTASGGEDPRRLELAIGPTAPQTAPATDSEAILSFTEATALNNLKCESLGTRVWCKVAQLRGGGTRYVDAEKPRPARGPDGLIPAGVDDSKARAKAEDFDATREVSCAQERDQELGTCKAEVARSGGGNATVVVTFANGFARQLYFTHGAFMRGSATMSGVGTDTDWDLAGSVYTIRVDGQRFKIPESFVLGK